MAAFRFALQASGAATPVAWRDLARKAEDLGYSTLYVPDHLDDQWAPMVALAVAAEATTTLRVGTLVLDNDFRHPVVLAKEAATLDVVTGGRFELGMGAGWMSDRLRRSRGSRWSDPRCASRAWPRASRSCAPCGETGSATFAGEHYRVTDAVASPTPVTPGGPPLVIGGGGRRILTLAGQYARTREHRAQPRRRLRRPRGGGGVGRREVRRAGAVGPGGRGRAGRRPRVPVLDGDGAGRPQRARSGRVAGAAVRPHARPVACDARRAHRFAGGDRRDPAASGARSSASATSSCTRPRWTRWRR